MSRTLWRVELRPLLPYALGALVLAAGAPWACARVLDAWDLPVRPPADYLPALGLVAPGVGDLLGLLGAALVLAAALRLLARRSDRGLDRTLGGLPLAPARLFRLRALGVLALSLSLPLTRHALYLAAQVMQGAWPPGFLSQLVLPLLGRELLAALLVAGLALGCAPWRQLAWPLGAVLLLAPRLLAPGLLDPLRLAASGPGFGGAPPGGGALSAGGLSVGTLSSGTLILWGALAGTGVLIARRLFAHPADPAARLGRVLRGAGPLGPLLPRLSRLVLGCTALVAPAVLLGSNPGEAAQPLRFARPAFSSTTGAYRFRLSGRGGRALDPLIARADGIHAAVARALGAEDSAAAPIEVDLRGEGRNADAQGAALRLARLTAERLLAPRLPGQSRGWRSALGVFRAGLVRHLAWEATGADPFASRFHAAVLHSRSPVRLDELFDLERLEGLRGPEAAAPLGELLVSALREVAGPDAPPRLLARLGRRPRAAVRSPADGEALWGDLLDTLGCTRAALEERVLALLEEGVVDDPRAGVPLPRLDVFVDQQDDPPGWRIFAICDRAVPPGWSVVCRVRQRRPDRRGRSSRPPRAVSLGEDESGAAAFYVPASPFSGQPWVQLGLRPLDPPLLGGTIWETWTPP